MVYRQRVPVETARPSASIQEWNLPNQFRLNRCNPHDGQDTVTNQVVRPRGIAIQAKIVSLKDLSLAKVYL